MLIALVLFAACLTIAFCYRAHIRSFLANVPTLRRAINQHTVDEQIERYGTNARARLIPVFKSRRISYPPEFVAILAIKDTRTLEVYAAAIDGAFRYIRTYPILGASGELGPKLREGDFQVPEGIYRISSLEPNTPYHLGLRINYPNEIDFKRAQADGRTDPGSDILIHGNTCSIGCLAVGDEASEDLFVLVHDTADQNVPLIIAPVDMRYKAAPAQKPTDPHWLPELYREITAALSKYPLPRDVP